MDRNQELIEGLQQLKAELEAAGLTGTQAYADISESIKQTTEAQSELAEKAAEVEEKNEKTKKQKKNWQAAASAVSDFGSALSSIGQASDDEGLQVAGIIAQTLAEVALGFAQASKGPFTSPWEWIAFGVAGIAQMASLIAQIHSLTGAASGTIVGGNSPTGDRKLIRVNSHEMVLSPTQQYNLFNAIQQGELGGGNGIGIVEFELRGSNLYGALKNYEKEQGRVGRNKKL